MSCYFFSVSIPPRFQASQVTIGGRPLAAFADGPVADTAEPVAAEAGRPIPEADGDDGDAVT